MGKRKPERRINEEREKGKSPERPFHVQTRAPSYSPPSKGMGVPAIISLLANPQDTPDVSIGNFGTYHHRHHQ